GADFHAMFNDVVLGQVGFLRENEGFNTYMAARFDLLDRGEFTFNVSALMNWGFGVVRAPDPEDHNQPGSNRLDRLRYGMAANVRWKQDRKSTRLNSSHVSISYAVFCLKKKKKKKQIQNLVQ